MTPFNVAWPQCQLLNWTCVMYLLKALGMNAWATSTVLLMIPLNWYSNWAKTYMNYEEAATFPPSQYTFVNDDLLRWTCNTEKAFWVETIVVYCFIKQMSHFGVFIQSIDLYFQTHTMSLEIRMTRSSPILWPTHEALRHICWTPISPVATAELDESEAHTIIIITNIPWRF